MNEKTHTLLFCNIKLLTEKDMKEIKGGGCYYEEKRRAITGKKEVKNPKKK